jgi:hypothetical protein
MACDAGQRVMPETTWSEWRQCPVATSLLKACRPRSCGSENRFHNSPDHEYRRQDQLDRAEKMRYRSTDRQPLQRPQRVLKPVPVTPQAVEKVPGLPIRDVGSPVTASLRREILLKSRYRNGLSARRGHRHAFFNKLDRCRNADNDPRVRFGSLVALRFQVDSLCARPLAAQPR